MNAEHAFSAQHFIDSLLASRFRRNLLFAVYYLLECTTACVSCVIFLANRVDPDSYHRSNYFCFFSIFSVIGFRFCARTLELRHLTIFCMLLRCQADGRRSKRKWRKKKYCRKKRKKGKRRKTQKDAAERETYNINGNTECWAGVGVHSICGVCVLQSNVTDRYVRMQCLDAGKEGGTERGGRDTV